jgi:NAD(P)-dependent dehydrogenase (short-subunit alcohol dehydrogenase family)
MNAVNDQETALVLGAAAPLGAELVVALAQPGREVLALPDLDLAALERLLAGQTRLNVLVLHLPVARTPLRFESVSDADFDAALEGHFLQAVAAAQAVLAHMPAGGRIVWVGSRGHLGAWGGAHLMAVAAAQLALVRSMALELESEQIRVNLVAAPFIGDPQDTPAQRGAVLRAAAYLAAADSGLTGQALLLDGQAALRMGEARQR